MTNIRWTDQTRNPIRALDLETNQRGWFCTKVSDGCKNCYAEKLNARFGNGLPYRADVANRAQFILDVRVLEGLIRQRKGKKTFLCDMTDLFHPKIPFEMIDFIYAAMALCPQHTFQILTKRPERALAYYRSRENGFVDGPDKAVWNFVHLIGHARNGLLPHLRAAGWRLEVRRDEEDLKDAELIYSGPLPLPNVWVGTSVENQKAADERIPLLLQIPAAIHFLSCEPLLSEVDVTKYLMCQPYAGEMIEPRRGTIYGRAMRSARLRPRVEWVIVGGESGPKYREMDVQWAKSLRDQCRAADVAFFYKQGSAYRTEQFQLLDGARHEQFPNEKDN